MSDRRDDESTGQQANAVRELPAEERHRQRLLHFGAQVLSDGELLAVLLAHGSRGASALQLGRNLLERAGGLHGLLSREDTDLTRRIAQAADAVGIHLSEHLILEGPDRWVSLRGRGGW